ncbi:MAG: TIGR02597 family protein [Verrucomicrobia bacterium]|nr:TIGR02597 family protein [Verrucomicrobiota bacterium]
MIFRIKPILCFGLLLLGSTCWLPAQEVVSGIFGFQKITLSANSDSIIAVPFNRLSADSGLVSSVSGSVVQVQGTPNWTASQFVYSAGVQSNTYYARFDSGAWEGRYFTITNNGTNSLTLNLAGEVLAGVLAGDAVSIIPYWTLGAVFPNGGNPTNWNGVHVTTSTFSHKTDLLIPDFTGNGKNLAPTLFYYLYTNATSGANWRLSGQTTNNNDDILRPNTYFIVRNSYSNATFVAMGDVQTTKTVVGIRGSLTVVQDNFVGLPRPIEVSLDNSGLLTNYSFTVSSSSFNQKDQLLIFNYTNVAKNQAPVDFYYYLTNAGWRKSGAGTTNYGPSNVFVSGGGFIIRRATNSITGPFWTNSPTY